MKLTRYASRLIIGFCVVLSLADAIHTSFVTGVLLFATESFQSALLLLIAGFCLEQHGDKFKIWSDSHP